MSAPVVVYRDERAYVDRSTLARLTGRSEHTIRLRCPVARRRGKTPLYDCFAEVERLSTIPQRNR